MKRVCIIANVWPEPSSTAAGHRMLQLLDFFRSINYHISFACTATRSEHAVDLESMDIHPLPIRMNDTSFDATIKQIHPDIVVFDRFMTEEQFGWRVSQYCPDALRILNTEDLHFLRKVRQEAFKTNSNFDNSLLLKSDHTKREIASIYRCDLTLVISDFEMQLLKEVFHIPDPLILYLPFLLNPIDQELKKQWPTFENRNHFMTIGNFKHEPNWNSILYLKETIWPLIQKKIPEAELHIYGSYPSHKVTQLHHPKDRFFIKGWAKDSKEVMRNSKVCLAPLRFGAGIKGKLVEAMLCGTPSVTTTVGSEGICSHDDEDWNGFVMDNPEKLAMAAIRLYTNKPLWTQSQQNGIQIINTRFNKEKHSGILLQKINAIAANMEQHRTSNFTGSMLQYHAHRSTEYLSRWIEEKNKAKNP